MDSSYDRKSCTTIRILCLHGGGQSGNDLRCQLLPLEERLAKNHNVELYYIDSPISGWISNDIDSDNNMQDNVATRMTKSYETDDKHLKWFDDVPTQYNSTLASTPSKSSTPSDSSEENRVSSELEKNRKYQYIGLDASLLHIHQIWQRGFCSNPFHGIIAFHQGTVLTSILLLSKKLKNCEFVIFSSGYILNDPPPDRGCMGVNRELFMNFMHQPQSHNTIAIDSSSDANSCNNNENNLHENVNDMDGQENNIFPIGNPNLKSLHLIGKRNTRISPMKSRLLANRFHNVHVYEHCFTDDYTFPNRSRDINIMGKFIIQCKNDILNRLNTSMIMKAQTKLALLTQEASNLIASTMSDENYDPPKSLMAVIAPKTVGIGGWVGPKRRDPNDGGGALYPSESMKKKGGQIKS